MDGFFLDGYEFVLFYLCIEESSGDIFKFIVIFFRKVILVIKVVEKYIVLVRVFGI